MGLTAAGSITTSSFQAGATIPRVTLADTLTTYTGNTPQTGDGYAILNSGTHGLAALLAELRLRIPGKTWYVATTGNDSNAGTAEAPFLTIGAAVTAASSFDRIRIKNGTYNAVVDIDTANKYGLHLIGESRTGVVINGTVTGFFAVIMLEHGTTLESLTVTPNGSDGTGISGFDKHNINLINCDINGYWDGALVAYALTAPRGLRARGCNFRASFDGFNFTGCKDFLFEDCTFYTDGTYSGPQDNNAARGETNSPTGLFRNCTFEVSNGVAHAGTTKDGTCVTLGGADTDVRFETCMFKGRKTSATDHGRLIGIGTEEDTPVVYRASLRDCKFDLSTSGDGTVYEIDNPTAGTMVTLDATPFTAARISTVGNCRTDLVPTTAARTLDVTATGAAGIDWNNVENPTTTLGLSGTTVKNATDIATTLGSPAGASIAADIAGVSAGSNPTTLQATTIATLTSQTVFTLTAGSADNDAYNGHFAVFQDQSTSAQKSVCVISDYVGATKTVTLLNAPAFTIATGDTVSIIASPNSAIVSPFNVDKDHTWQFHNASQTTAPNILSENIGFIGLLSMDFTEPMPGLTSIASISSATFANISGTEPTVTSSSVSADKKKAHILINAASASANTYTLTVTIVTTDNQTIVRSGRLTVS